MWVVTGLCVLSVVALFVTDSLGIAAILLGGALVAFGIQLRRNGR
jgi:hypothetical protein